MYVKLTNGQPDQFPYTIGQLRRDNPNTSFPKTIPEEMLNAWGVFTVREADRPQFDPLVETVVRENLPYEEGGKWVIGYTVKNKPIEVAKAAIRNKRDNLLASTDWIVIMHTEKGANIPMEWEVYRQALRDITDQEGFPYSVIWPVKPE